MSILHQKIPYSTQVVNTLTFPNPFEPEEVFIAYKEAGSRLLVPRFVPNVPKTKCTVKVHNADIGVQEGTLRPYQQEAMAELVSGFKKANSLLLTAPTGAGKSFVMSHLLAKLRVKTLVLAHLSMLTVQLYEEFSSTLKADVRLLSSTQPELGDVCICTFQYLMANPLILKELSETMSMVMVDECENMVSTSRLGVLFELQPKFALMVSATPSRDLTGRTPVIQYLTNGSIQMIPDVQIEPKFIMLDFREHYWKAPTSKMFYKKSLVSFLLNSGILLEVINLAKFLIENKEGAVWIVVESLKLQGELKKHISNSQVINGKTSAKRRADILHEVHLGTCRCLLASAPLSAGISIPNLAYAIRLQPHSSSEELLKQQVGRLKRNADFKQHQTPLWFDLAIPGGLEYGSKKRYKQYKEPMFLTTERFINET